MVAVWWIVDVAPKAMLNILKPPASFGQHVSGGGGPTYMC